MENTRAFPTVDIVSNHNLVLAKFKIKFKIGKKKAPKRKKWNLQKLSYPSTKHVFQLELRNRFDSLEDELDLSAESADTSFIIQIPSSVAQQTTFLGNLKTKKKPGISEATLDLTDEHREARKMAFKNPSHNKLTRQVHQSLKTGKVKWFEEKCQML